MSREIEVIGCRDCMFAKQQDLQFNLCCGLSSFKPIDRKHIMFGLPNNSPSWCPLKAGDITVKLKQWIQYATKTDTALRITEV